MLCKSNPSGSGGRVELGDQRHARLGDRSLLTCNIGQVIPQELLMIEGKARYARHQRPFNDVGRIQPAAESNFEDAGISSGPGEGEHCSRSRHLKKARLDARPSVEHFGKQRRQRLIFNQTTGDPDALVEPD